MDEPNMSETDVSEHSLNSSSALKQRLDEIETKFKYFTKLDSMGALCVGMPIEWNRLIGEKQGILFTLKEISKIYENQETDENDKHYEILQILKVLE